MKKIIRAKKAGFCYGVRRAVSIIEDLLKKGKSKIYTLGPIIHNRFVIEEFRERGVEVVDDPEKLRDGVVVLRAHGVEKHIEENLRRRGIEVVDATCPFVKKAQHAASHLYRDGYFPIIIGEKEHAEVKGITSYVDEFEVVEKKEEVDGAIKRIKEKGRNKVGIVSQTTQPVSKFSELVCLIIPFFSEIKVINTICSATMDRQEEALKLAKKVDVMIVVGDKGSRNTRKLYELCMDVNEKTYFVEDSSELDPRWFTSAEMIGITAGASTPDKIISGVEKRIEDITGGAKIGDG